MDELKIKELETKLKEMFELSEQDQVKPEKKRTKPAANVVIRRRKGHQDKRIFLNSRS